MIRMQLACLLQRAHDAIMAVTFLDPGLLAYLEQQLPPREAGLLDMEHSAAERGFPIIGPACGALCHLLARLAGARAIFELGSGFGYSTAWFAKALRDNGGGVVHHTVWDEALSQEAQRRLQQMGLADLVRFHCAEAIGALQATPGPFDICLLDIDKTSYPEALPVIAARLRPGGLLIADNILWHGRVWKEEEHSESTEAIRRFTAAVMQDSTWWPSIVPLRDGLLLALKR